jgi:hypothetical protein
MNFIFIIYSIILSTFSANQVTPKLCIDCKFYKRGLFTISSEFGKCELFLKEKNTDYFLVNGKKDNNIEHHYCSTARYSDRMCGKEGKFYEKSE